MPNTGFCWCSDLLLGLESSYWSWDVSLETDDSFRTPDLTWNCLKANLGIYYCDVKQINKFAGREQIEVQNK